MYFLTLSLHIYPDTSTNKQKMAEVSSKLNKLQSKSNYAKSIAMATDAIEQNECFVRNLYGADIPCELHSCAIDLCVFIFMSLVPHSMHPSYFHIHGHNSTIVHTCYVDTPTHHIHAFQVRSHSMIQVGDYDQAIADATDALAMIQLRKTYVDRPEGEVQRMEARLLYDRGEVLLKNAGWGETKIANIAKDAFDAGLRDIRAALAVARASREWWENSQSGHGNDIEIVSALYIAIMATKKFQAGASRPHYSAESLVSFCKDACVGPYSFDRHLCLGCGAVPTETVDLQTCEKCRQYWFCSKACLSMTWKSIHKPLCQPDRAFGDRGKLTYWYISDFEKKFIDERIEIYGALCVTRAKQERNQSENQPGLPFAICRDANGLYFDQFTDHPFIFLPSQANRMLEVGASVDKAYEQMESVSWLTNLSGKMTARQISNWRKLIMKYLKGRKQAKDHPEKVAEIVKQMEMLARMQG